MALPPDTQPSLLVRIRDERDLESWSRFVGIYTPAIYEFLQQQGLQDADAADLTQDVMASVAAAIRSFDYQPARGRFRGWLFTVVKNRLRNFWRGAAAQPVVGGAVADQQLQETTADVAADWDRSYERHLFVCAAEHVRAAVNPSTWEAFHATVVIGEKTTAVARRLSMSPAAVRLAKARVIARIKSEIASVEGEPI